MNKTNSDLYFNSLFQNLQNENVTDTENPEDQINETERKLKESRLFLGGLLFFLVIVLAVFIIKIYNKIITSCAPSIYPGIVNVEEDDIEEVIVFSADMDELITLPTIQIEEDQETNNNSDNQIFKKNN